MFQTKKDQRTGNNNQNQGSNEKVCICFHDLFPPSRDIENENCEDTTYNCGKEISVNNVPFDHFLSPYSVRLREIPKNIANISKDTPEVATKASRLSGRTKTGEIAPAENQATATFPEISDNFDCCAIESFIINVDDNKAHMFCQCNMEAKFGSTSVSARDKAVLK
ncbi:hypothetical protein A3F86_01860 [candidate division WOR-1 bacterium RIFCSPLOWO2_12_FULL_45_9]|uniref:Uncharacterized protein n=1 Tax=candidate division WOR-1 bacterium RIFCSPLOWO2_12_FULL_45_9 TaxID=1802568 RepID=A0A1F4RNA7_UNCSA|nr:MAG: hypothetical protein A3F86_01860 [candidate division WOR-1 bacterium RIFCSPLOWO2_12_FULL_45_9]